MNRIGDLLIIHLTSRTLYQLAKLGEGPGVETLLEPHFAAMYLAQAKVRHIPILLI